MTEHKPVKLSANENCYGCSPLALEAIQLHCKNVAIYPEVFPVLLKQKLAEKYNVSAKNMVVGAGSVKIIDGLIDTFVGEEEEVLTFQNSFIAYSQLASFRNRKCVFAPLTDYRCVPNNLLPYITDKTKLIFIANPNNPTGTIITHDELAGLLKTVSQKIIVVIDEAYGEYVTDTTFPDSIALQKQYPNLVILHSFSKIYGLAGLRIGYAIANEKIANALNAVQIPFSINYLSANAAIAALSHTRFVTNSAKANAEQRAYLYGELNTLGYNTLPTQSNFSYLWFDTDDEKQKMVDTLLQNGIIICDMNVFGQQKAVRITIGDKQTNKRIVSLLAVMPT